jgi:hypothetical protein
MSETVSSGTRPETARPGLDGGRDVGTSRPRRWPWVAVLLVVVVVAGGVAADAAGVFKAAGSSQTPNSGSFATSTAAVARQTLTSQMQVSATLGDGGSYNVVDQQAGTITSLPQLGQTVREGQAIYEINGKPVVLLYGQVPSFENLSEGMIGPDVAELNTDLVKLGYTSAALLGPNSGWDYFSGETAYGLEQLQTKLGLTVTGTLPFGQAVFLTSAALITGLGPSDVLDGPAQPGQVVLTATSTTPVVTIALDASEQTDVKAGDQVGITLPSGAVTRGVVTYVGNVASVPASAAQGGSSTPTITVLVSLSNPKAAGHLTSAPVTVTITTGSAANALVVPVDALLAQANGGYAVEVTGPRGHHLVPVTLGLFDDAKGLVQVSGALTPGQRVVVPAI